MTEEHATINPNDPAWLVEEKKTLQAMLLIYCGRLHRDKPKQAGYFLCEDCARLRTYAFKRLENCRYGADKTTCANCPTHCYAPKWREGVRQVMRFSGPRMMTRHPILALRHLLKEWRERKQDEQRLT